MQNKGEQELKIHKTAFEMPSLMQKVGLKTIFENTFTIWLKITLMIISGSDILEQLNKSESFTGGSYHVDLN